MKNYGIISGYRLTDYAGGSLPYEVRVPDGNWRPYIPTTEKQFGKEDFMDCTVRSGTNSLEIQHKQQTGIEINLNDREIALGCGVTQQGAYLYQWVDYIRKTGCALQEAWPDTEGTWEEQYSQPPKSIRTILDSQKAYWLTQWDVKYERIPFDKKSLKYHLKHAPIQVVLDNPAHALVDIYSEQDIERVFDSYPPWEITVPGKYPGKIVAAQKIVLYKREQAVPDEHLLVDINPLDSGKQVQKLRNALVKIGWAETWSYNSKKYINVAELPDMFYGQDWYDVVFNFQRSNLSRTSWAYWWAIFWNRGKLVDATTREIINNNLSKK